MDHNGFEPQTRHFPATIKINWTTPAWYIAWRDFFLNREPMEFGPNVARTMKQKKKNDISVFF